MWTREFKKKLIATQKREYELIHNEIRQVYEEISDLWFRLEELQSKSKSSKRDMSRM